MVTEEIRLQKAGDSVSATLPKEMMERLRLAPGDRVFAVETDRGVLLMPYDPDFDVAVQAFSQVRRQYPNTLRKLAD